MSVCDIKTDFFDIKVGVEQAPGSELHPCDESEKVYCDFFGTFLVQQKGKS